MLLARLLAAWRANPHPALAEAIARVGVVESRERGPVTDLTWRPIALQGDPVDVDRLIDATWPRTSTRALERMVVLAGFPPDPRFALRLPAIAALYRGNPDALRLRAVVGKMTSPRGEHAPLADAERALLREAAAFARPPTEALAAAWEYHHAHPGDLAHRPVLADALLAAGDPRGELIVLQLGPETTESKARIRRLIDEHVDEWLGVPCSKRTFVAGFPYALRVTAVSLAKLLRAPAWLTVQEVVFQHEIPRGELADVLAQMPALRRLAVPRAAMLEGVTLPPAVACGEPWNPPPAVRVAIMPWSRAIPRGQLDAVGFTNVRSADIAAIVDARAEWPPEVRLCTRDLLGPGERVRIRRDGSGEASVREARDHGILRNALGEHGIALRRVAAFELWD